MEKIIKGFILAIIVACLVCGCTNNSHIKQISLEEFERKISNKESFVLYVGNKNCSHCQSYKPTLEKVLNDYNINIYQIDNSKLTEDEYEKFEQYLSVNGTPTIAFITNGEEETTLNRIVGESSYDNTVERFKTNGYIK